MLRAYGEEKFPGISQAEIEFCSAGVQEKSPEEYEAEGRLLVGVGGGMLDEHAPINGARKKRESASTLVAKALNLTEDPILEAITDAVAYNDNTGNSSYLGLPHVMKLLYAQNPDPMYAIEYAVTTFFAAYQEQYLFHSQTAEEFKKAVIEKITTAKGELLMATIESDNDQVMKYSRSRYGVRAAVTIQKKSSGHVCVQANKYNGLDLYDASAIVRFLEQKAKGSIETRGHFLKIPGVVKGAEEWMLHEGLQMLANGTQRNMEVPPTKLSLKMIRLAVKSGLDPNYYPERRAEFCRNGTCGSKKNGDTCFFYEIGLNRCVKVQVGMKEAV